MKTKTQLLAQYQDKKQELVDLPKDAHWQDEYEIQSQILSLREEIENQK